jgi:AraC-like DNA-binding protein
LLKVWFDSGHVLAGDTLHKMQYREFPFTGFEWVDFSGYDVSKEKLKPLSTQNIESQDSLLYWVLKTWKPDGQHRWRGWLATSDESIADVAFNSGFNSISRFNDAFRRACGCSPRDYRRTHSTE